MEKGTMIRKPKRIGKRLNIIVLGHIDNDQVGKLIALMDKYNIKSKILFNHYGRATKCKRELDAWFTKYNPTTTNPFLDKLKRADKNLEKDLEELKKKMERADQKLFKTTE